MLDKYKITNNDKAYFITSTVIGWIDLFTRINLKDVIVENAWDYLYSSARNYADMEGFVDVVVLGHKPLIINKT